MTDSVLALAFQQDSGAGAVAAAAGGSVFALFFLAFFVLMIASMWKIFTKAGEPGWAVLIPIYNVIVLLKIAGKEWWWLFLFIIPLVNFVVGIIVTIALAKNFGKDIGFALGLLFLGFIFYPILGFGEAVYRPV
jgi:Family of unknown function (DUF5684)